MKKKTLRIWGCIGIAAVAVLIFLASYTEKKNAVVNDYKGVSMIADNISAEGLVLSIKNETKEEIVFDDGYIIEKKTYGQWYKLPSQSLKTIDWEDEPLVIPPESTVEDACSVEWLEGYGKLSAGSYRLLKKFETTDGEKHVLAVSFSL